MSIGGLAVPVPTMFSDTGGLDVEKNSRFARELSEAGVPHLFLLGSLGEFPSVTEEERRSLLTGVIQGLPAGTDVWVGCGAPSTFQAVHFARSAEESGAGALVAVPPYYLRPTENAVSNYYRAIRAAVQIPLLAYNIPSLVGYPLTAELVLRLAEEGVLAGVKDTSGSLSSVQSFMRGAPAGFAVLPGDDRLATESILSGAAGAVMGTANVLPKLGVQLVAAALQKDQLAAKALQTVVDRLSDVVSAGPFPSTDKFLAQKLRGCAVGYRSPYDPLTPEEEQLVLAALGAHEAEFRSYL
jgi:4-hydroxy-tetrahydrodipicolinate synthase